MPPKSIWKSQHSRHNMSSSEQLLNSSTFMTGRQTTQSSVSSLSVRGWGELTDTVKDHVSARRMTQQGTEDICKSASD